MKKKPHEEHVNHERYMVTYADLITLLLAFFIILFAMSDENPHKFEQVAQSLSAGFNKGSESIINTDLATNPELKRQQTNEQNVKMMASVKEQNELRELKKRIDQKVSEMGLEKQITTTLGKQGLMISLTDKVLFNSGSAELKNENSEIIKVVGSIISEVQNPVQVSGYTDNVPINTGDFPSNWELSGQRSMTVLKYMIDNNKGLNPERIYAAGFGEYHPIANNDTEEGREKNRRVEILVERMNGENLLEAK